MLTGVRRARRREPVPFRAIYFWIHLLCKTTPTGTQAILGLCRDTPVKRACDVIMKLPFAR